jgi:phenylpropionate dioxygenase-like ring-hydroxylating dioxygenase large terminal subunit
VLRSVGLDLMKRALAVVEAQWPEMAERHLRVPLEVYRSEDLWRRDRELVARSPLALVASAEIARPHDFVVRDLMGRSLLLTRDGEGRPHAFLNYCRHRGAEPARGCGNARVFSCPYHAWSYDTKGRLVGLPRRDRYADLDLSQLALVELPSEERHGLLWVVPTPGTSIDVQAHLGALDGEIAALGIAGMTYHNALEGELLPASWKAVAEGLMEALHVPYVHASTFDLNPQAAALDLVVHDAIGPHVRYVMPMFGIEEAARLRSTPEADWAPADWVGAVWWISPGLLLAQDQYGLIYADLTPGPSPGEAAMRYGWLAPHGGAPAGADPPEEMARRAARAVGEDIPVWAGCGRGLSRGAHGHVLIGRNEKAVQLVHESLARQIGYDGLDYV